MNWSKLSLSASLNTRIVWSLLVALMLIDALGLHLFGITLVPKVLAANIITVLVLLVLSFVYTVLRPSPRIAGITHMAAIVLTFTATTSILSYLTVAWQRPLIDGQLAAFDRAIGFDWKASYDWIKAHPYVRQALYFAYSMLIPQLVLLLLVLNFRGRCGRSWEMIWLFMISCLGCMVFSALYPAAGAFGFFNVETDRAYVQVFMSLHNGTMKVIGDETIRGIIQFPSFHVALGILLTYVARGMRLLFILLLEVNILLTISTPAIGGHHLADVIGGAILAALTIFIVRRLSFIPDTNAVEPM